MSVEKKCAVCGDAFSVPKHRESSAKTCSQKCRGVLIAKLYAEKRVALVCGACGESFAAPLSHAQRRVYCSRKCANRHYQFNGPSGAAHYAWNGGQTRHADGYRYMRVANHPFGTINAAGYVFEHRVVIEERMRSEEPSHPFLTEIDGQLYLRPEIEVHHINLIKNDNRPSNLLACTRGAHRDIHAGNAPMVGEVWPLIDGLVPSEPRKVVCKCQTCGSEFVKKRSDVRRGNGRFFCSRECYRKQAKTPFLVTINGA